MIVNLIVIIAIIVLLLFLFYNKPESLQSFSTADLPTEEKTIASELHPNGAATHNTPPHDTNFITTTPTSVTNLEPKSIEELRRIRKK
ncbi:hypothetical protein [Urbanus proteus nucleopolyhedrovirus]|uniref:Uncharacterized protein n=1 Tax=Urbanus proteus nucleopolyhedrovirus TaxID=1675866 RepID=A0A162GTN5_9ABAC|nr:hypothetical protein [Urbanus proteus nucleopolyhedrovirus]AKR17283.1 hypothetical protein [Urbanus proteus nucleopolyhedrovirus]